MAQGSYDGINFTSITPDRLPGLASNTRVQNVSGVNGGIGINLGYNPVTFEVTVLCQGTWAEATDPPNSAYEQFLAKRQAVAVLTIHGKTATSATAATVKLEEVRLVREWYNGSSAVTQQELALTFTRLK